MSSSPSEALLVSENEESEHKFYVSLTDMRYNEESRRLEVSMRLFIDDFEKALALPSGTHLSEKLNEEESRLVMDYLKDRWKVSVNGDATDFELIGGELDADVVWIYLESAKLKDPQTIDVSNTTLIDLYEDQQNLVHLDRGGRIYSVFLSKRTPAEQILLD